MLKISFTNAEVSDHGYLKVMAVTDLDYLALILIAVMLRLLSIHIIVYVRLKQRMKYGTA